MNGLAIELQKILHDCPVHSDEYSRDVIRKMFGDKYDLTNMTLIGSGTIAQVYKIGNVCIKVRHPNVVNEVMDAVSIYNGIKDSYFMPTLFKSVCDVFFNGLITQLDFYNEYKNGIILKKLIHNINGDNYNLYIIPRMLDTSDECLVMEYEPSEHITLHNREHMNKHVLLKLYNGIDILSFMMMYLGFVHADFHFGNYGIRNSESLEHMKIVIYDFGHMIDARSLPLETRFDIIVSLETNDFNLLIKTLNLEYKHNTFIMSQISKHNDIGNREHFVYNLKVLIQYICLNGVQINNEILQILIACEKYGSITSLQHELEKDDEYSYHRIFLLKHKMVEYYDTYYPYDDIKIMRDTFGFIWKRATL